MSSTDTIPASEAIQRELEQFPWASDQERFKVEMDMFCWGSGVFEVKDGVAYHIPAEKHCREYDGNGRRKLTCSGQDLHELIMPKETFDDEPDIEALYEKALREYGIEPKQPELRACFHSPYSEVRFDEGELRKLIENGRKMAEVH